MIKLNSSISTLKLIGKYNWFHYFFIIDPIKLKLIKDSKLAAIAFSTLIMENNTSKQTNVNRFKDLEEITIKYLTESLDYKILDIGVSSGITSCELLELLKKRDIQFTLYATDKYPEIKFYKNIFFTAYLDSNNKVKSIYTGLFFFSDLLSWKYFLSKLFFKILSKFIVIKNNKVDHCSLLYQNFNELILNKKIVFFEHDIINPLNEKNFELVRVMNLLNLGYFSNDFITTSIENIKKSIKENGMLLVGRTINGKNHASLYKLKRDKFTLIESVNRGSEIHDLIIR
mgnify:CR=1 FL=1